MVFLAGDCRPDHRVVSTAAGGSRKSRRHDQPVGRWQNSEPACRYFQRPGVSNHPSAKFFGVAANVVEVIGGVVAIVFLALYFAAEAGLYAGGLVRLVPPARRAQAEEILHETASAIWYWMLGRLFSMTVLGVLTALGLWLLGVPLPVALGCLAGTMTFVPYVGSIVSAIPAVIIAASMNLTLAVYVIALYLGVHLVEGYILVPLVQRRAVHLPPALTLSAQLILGFLAGFIGLLFATPLVAAGLVLVRMIYVEDILGDRAGAEPAPFEQR